MRIVIEGHIEVNQILITTTTTNLIDSVTRSEEPSISTFTHWYLCWLSLTCLVKPFLIADTSVYTIETLFDQVILFDIWLLHLYHDLVLIDHDVLAV